MIWKDGGNKYYHIARIQFLLFNGIDYIFTLPVGHLSGDNRYF